MKKQNEPSAESLEQMPEINDQRFRRRPGRGHHVNSTVGEIVAIDADLWSHFGCARIAAMLDRWDAEDVSGEPDWDVEDLESMTLRRAPASDHEPRP